jgi:hypothetical protein
MWQMKSVATTKFLLTSAVFDAYLSVSVDTVSTALLGTRNHQKLRWN